MPSVDNFVITIGDAVVPPSVRSAHDVPPSVEYWYFVIVEPPSDSAALKAAESCWLDAVSEVRDGAEGRPAGTTVAETASDAAPAPTAFFARIRMV